MADDWTTNVLDWLKGKGLGWEALISLGMLVYDLGKRLAEREGVDPEVLAKREAAAQARLGRDATVLLDELRELTK
jgi:hypothetical protein